MCFEGVCALGDFYIETNMTDLARYALVCQIGARVCVCVCALGDLRDCDIEANMTDLARSALVCQVGALVCVCVCLG